ncbi:M1 family metallopeptidase [Hephaestia mangrovi]|uniref:M1 family metallopeptidase n=1 Tax=Hephaestia mangrovi TaxID=2873268 RepID=UPI001CA7768B|nr:M1 family metallopeptidase [Hephaestia mangrovi]MBY8827579.1 M1 family metallopeptidase [Hephaestia mangrovi]
MKLALPLGLGLLLSVSTPALAAGQLPQTVAPIAYDITVVPDAQAMTFAGSESVTIDVKQATSTIVLNALELNISRATFDGKAAPVSYDKALGQITVTLPTAASVGKHVMTFAWTGKINQTAAGFFAIDYTNTDGSKARMLVTQFEAPDARRFAPMWDEPGFKATFRLSAVAPGNETAFSNMPTSAVEKRNDGTKLYHFDVTPKMSSYLLFLGLGDVQRKAIQDGKTEIGVITRRGVVDQGDYALQSAKRVLDYYNDYFGTPYPLPKLDMIAGPGSSQFFGAMENWGAIFYFEPTLLFDPSHETVSDKQDIFLTVAHEMAHQWFGDLVTPQWWDDLWLNEGFASWMSNKAMGDLNPGWNIPAQNVAHDRERAMGADSTAATHPIIRHLTTVDEIGSAFDGITYSKGQAVIGMIESTVGADTFRSGIRDYMQKYNHSNTTTDDLWAEIGQAWGKPIKAIADDFTLQGGVPLINVASETCAGGKTSVAMSQGRFGLDQASKTPQTWQVPVKIGAIGGGTADGIVAGPTTTAMTVPGCGPVVVNLGQKSYFRTQYDAKDHAALVAAFAKLALSDQLGLLGDDMALARGGYQDLGVYFDTLDAVPQNADPLVWSMVAGDVGSFAALYRDTPLEAPLEAKAEAMLAPVLDRVGFEAKPDEEPYVTDLRSTLISQLGVDGDPALLAKARSYVAALKNDPEAIPAAIRRPILITYAYNATPAEWQALLDLTKAETNPVIKNFDVVMLGLAKDSALAQRALDLVKTATFTDPQRASLLAAVAQFHPDLAFDFAVANLDTVNPLLEESTRAGFVVGLAARSNDPAMPGKVQAFADKNLPEASRQGVKETLTAIAVRKAIADRLRPAVTKWAGR